jgi:sterol desaturase/sphingolipid hydroxylase (fatty acid hydroxylase superfamily)
MPTPLDILFDPISLIIIGMYALLMLWEAIFPGRQLPTVKFWKLRGIAVFFFYFYLSSYLPLLWAEYLPATLIDLSSFGNIGGAACGILLYEFGMYVWHRTMHRNKYLWKMFHQMHHSADLWRFFLQPNGYDRVDGIGYYMFFRDTGNDATGSYHHIIGNKFSWHLSAC